MGRERGARYRFVTRIVERLVRIAHDCAGNRVAERIDERREEITGAVHSG
jgi:hypothetical protein